MNLPIEIAALGASAAATPRNEEQRLLQTARQFESVFVRQMFAAMRSTVPTDGMLDGGAGEEMFTTLLDEHVADDAPAQLGDGFSRQIVAQFRRPLPAPGVEITR